MKLSGFVSGFQKFFSKERVMILAVFILLGMFLLWYSSGKTTVQDNMTSTTGGATQGASSKNTDSQPASDAASGNVEAPHPSEIFDKRGCESSGYVAQPVANPSDLLPKDENSQWAKLNPIDHNSPEMPDMLQAGYHIGLDTVGQTMKNANLQLRSDPVIPKKDIGPWNNSTYEPDLLRQPLEVGCKAGN